MIPMLLVLANLHGGISFVPTTVDQCASQAALFNENGWKDVRAYCLPLKSFKVPGAQ